MDVIVVIALVACATVMLLLPSQMVRRRAAMAVIALAVTALTSMTVAVIALDVVMVGSLTKGVLDDRRTSRRVWQLPEIADSIASSLRSGDRLEEALRRASALGHPSVSSDLRSVARRMETGVSADQAVGTQVVASGDHDARMFNSAMRLVVIHPETGSAPLTRVAEALRLRRLTREDVAAQVAQARTSAVVIACSPWVVGALVSVVDASHLRRLASTPYGRWCTLGAVTLSLVGAVSIRAMIERSGLG